MKQFVAKFLISIVLLMVLVGCGTSGATSNSGREQAQELGVTPRDVNNNNEQPEVNADGLNIAIVTSPSPVNDGCFNQASYDGILLYIKDRPNARVTPIRETSGTNEFALNMVEQISDSYDVIVCSGYEFAEVGAIAAKHPDTKYIISDSYPLDKAGEAIEGTNIYGMQFKEEQGGFMAGIVAASETNTGKVAEINGIGVPSNYSYQMGFQAGVNYCNAYYNTNAQYIELEQYAGTDVLGRAIGGNYVNSFNDELKAKEIACALEKAGVDILFPAAGGSGMGVFTAVKNNGQQRIIGVDVDQFYLGGTQESNVVITSVVKNISLNVYKQLMAIDSGDFIGTNETLGIDTNSVYIITNDESSNLMQSTIERLLEVEKLLKAGVIVPPSFYNSYTSTNYPGYEVK